MNERLFAAHMFAKHSFGVKDLRRKTSRPFEGGGNSAVSHPLTKLIVMTAAFAPAPQTIFCPQPVSHNAASGRAVSEAGIDRALGETIESELATVYYLPVRPTPGTYWVRRMVLSLAVVGVLLGVATFAFRSTAATTTSDMSGAGVTVVVQPGDTLWGIAKSLEPGADPRELVSRLTELAGSSALTPGQELAVPAQWLD